MGETARRPSLKHLANHITSKLHKAAMTIAAAIPMSSTTCQIVSHL